MQHERALGGSGVCVLHLRSCVDVGSPLGFPFQLNWFAVATIMPKPGGGVMERNIVWAPPAYKAGVKFRRAKVSGGTGTF
jgi:hypothetical protein